MEKEEEKIQDSFDFFQPKKDKFLEEEFSLPERKIKPRKKDAKKLAQKLLKDYGYINGSVNLKEVIGFLQKKYTLYISGEKVTGKLDGMIAQFPEEDGTSFYVLNFNPDAPWVRRRFTIAHELGHLLLETFCNGNTSTEIEQEAHIFAAELLLPKKYFKEQFLKHGDVKKLSEIFKVSTEAITRKVMSDRLL